MGNKQQEKSKKMRRRLIDATLSCLQEFGYHGASLSKILEKAGVSRGAWRHHFENKTDLVASAAEFMLTDAAKKSMDIISEISLTRLDISFVAEHIWKNYYQGSYRDIWIEFNVACRTEKELQKRLTPVIEKFFCDLEDIWEDKLKHLSSDKISAVTILNLTLYLMRGMALQSISLDRPEHYKEMRESWVKIIANLIKNSNS